MTPIWKMSMIAKMNQNRIPTQSMMNHANTTKDGNIHHQHSSTRTTMKIANLTMNMMENQKLM
jgi:hypothetical protein